MAELDTIKARVFRLLDEHPELRNDDRELIFEYWCEYDKYNPKEPEKPITSPETIRRIRQKIQAEGRFLPTDPKVIERRRRREDKVRKWAVDAEDSQDEN